MTNSNFSKDKDIRNTFGVKNKKGQPFKDIIFAYLKTYPLTVEDFDLGFIYDNGMSFTLLTDKKIRQELGLYGNTSAIISFQIRDTGKFAVARIIKDQNKE